MAKHIPSSYFASVRIVDHKTGFGRRRVGQFMCIHEKEYADALTAQKVEWVYSPKVF